MALVNLGGRPFRRFIWSHRADQRCNASGEEQTAAAGEAVEVEQATELAATTMVLSTVLGGADQPLGFHSTPSSFGEYFGVPVHRLSYTPQHGETK